MLKITPGDIADTNPGAPSRSQGPRWPATPHDDLKLPDGRRVGDCPSHSLASEFDRLKIEGFNHTLGRLSAIELYAATIAAVAKAGADAAVAEWLERNK